MKAIFKNTHKITFSHLKNIVSKDELRPVMCGAYIDLKNKVIVGTDAHVLVMYPIEITENDFNVDGLIVPIRFFNHLKYMVDIPKADFDLLDYVLTDEYAEVYFLNELVFRCKYIDGTYPKYEAVIPKADERQDFKDIGFNLDIVGKLINALPKINPNTYKFSFYAENKNVLLEMQNLNYGEPIKAILMPAMLNN